MFFRLFSIFNKQAEQGLDRGFIPADHRKRLGKARLRHKRFKLAT